MSHNDWILDVLADLKSFALANDLGGLAEQLEDTTLIAAAEIATKAEEAHDFSNGGTRQSGSDIGGIGRHRHA